MVVRRPQDSPALEGCAVEFGILGPVELICGGRPVAVGGARTRAVLAMLLVNANRVVPAEKLAGELWPGYSPDRGGANLQVRLSQLRRALKTAGGAERLVTRPPPPGAPARLARTEDRPDQRRGVSWCLCG